MPRLPDEIPVIHWPNVGITLLRPTSKAALSRAWAALKGQKSGATIATDVIAGVKNFYVLRDSTGATGELLLGIVVDFLRPNAWNHIEHIPRESKRVGHRSGVLVPMNFPDGTRDATIWFTWSILAGEKKEGPHGSSLRGTDKPVPYRREKAFSDAESYDSLLAENLTGELSEQHWYRKLYLELRTYGGESGGYSTAVLTGRGLDDVERILYQHNGLRFFIEARPPTSPRGPKFDVYLASWTDPGPGEDPEWPWLGGGSTLYEAFLQAEIVIEPKRLADWINGKIMLGVGEAISPMDATCIAFGQVPPLAMKQLMWLEYVK